VVLFPILGLAIAACWRRLVTRRDALLAVPYVGATLFLWWTTFGTQWDVMGARLTYWALPSWALLGAIAVLRLGSVRLLVVLESALGVGVILVWLAAAHAFLI
jgi:hypothetical protein